jgi:hypothetical protein
MPKGVPELKFFGDFEGKCLSVICLCGFGIPFGGLGEARKAHRNEKALSKQRGGFVFKMKNMN